MPKMILTTHRAFLFLWLMTIYIFMTACSYSPPDIAGLAELQKSYIVDVHTHIAGVGAGGSGNYISPRLRNNWRYKVYLRAFGVSEKELQEKGDAFAFQRLSGLLAESKWVDSAVVLALDGVVNAKGELDLEASELVIPNEFVAQETAKYDNLCFGASIHPNRLDALARLEKVKAQGAVLIKWLPSIQHINPADPALIPFYQQMKRLNLPLLTHTGHEKSFTQARNEYADPLRLTLPLRLGVTVIAAHAASSGENDNQDNMERLLSLFGQYPNLYTDISSLTQLNKLGYLAKLLKHSELTDRLLYGSDMPLIATPLVSPWYFPFDLTTGQMWAISRESNPWDRDIMLKRALGVPVEVFTQPGKLLNL